MKVYKFKETGNKYVVLSEGEFKHPEKRNWVKSVIYSPITSGNDNDKLKIYVREFNEFFEKFEEVI